MSTTTDFKTRFPEFTATDDARIQLFLNDSALVVSDKWGALRDIGILYLSAHLLAVSQLTDSGSTSSPKNIVSKSVEGVSVSYSGGDTTESKYSFYDTTSYGKRYLSLMRQIGTGGAMLV